MILNRKKLKEQSMAPEFLVNNKGDMLKEQSKKECQNINIQKRRKRKNTYTLKISSSELN